MKGREDRTRTGGAFPRTSWSLVLGVRDRRELNRLILQYWKPLYFFVRRRGYPSETAQDIVQEFWAGFLEHDSLSKADPDRGRFRTFLLASLGNFIKNWKKAKRRLKRGGGRTPLSLDFPEGEHQFAQEVASQDTPEAAYHRAWVRDLLARSMAKLEGDPKHIQAFRLRTDGADYEAICKATGLTEAAAKSAVHRMRLQFKSRLAHEVLPTVRTLKDLEQELEEVLLFFS